MAFKLENVVPWGRNLAEYREMFRLTDEDMKKRIAGFGDGPASFNCQSAEQGFSVTSYDPIYGFTSEQLEQRIEEVRTVVMEQMAENRENYVWTKIKSLDELEEVRMSAMRRFLADFERGKAEGRYICHELPTRIPAEDGSYDIGLSSHFLLMYTALGLEFHISAISEMLRVCREVRIFPIVDLDAGQSELTANVIEHFSREYEVNVVETDYEFQKNGNKMLVIGRKN